MGARPEGAGAPQGFNALLAVIADRAEQQVLRGRAVVLGALDAYKIDARRTVGMFTIVIVDAFDALTTETCALRADGAVVDVLAGAVGA